MSRPQHFSRPGIEVRPLGRYRVYLKFDDGVQGEIDLEPLLSPFDGVFEPLKDLIAWSECRGRRGMA